MNINCYVEIEKISRLGFIYLFSSYLFKSISAKNGIFLNESFTKLQILYYIKR